MRELKLDQLQKSVDSKEVTSLENWLKVLGEARKAAEAQAQEALNLAVQEEAVRKDIEDQRNQEKARAIVLAARMRSLESKIDARAEAIAAQPQDYSEIPAWVETEFAGR